MSHLALKPTSVELRIAALGGDVVTGTLVAVGEGLRRVLGDATSLEESRKALRALEVSSVVRALRSVDVDFVAGELDRARQEAFEAAMSEVDDERALFRESAASGLEPRDRAESLAYAALELAVMLPDSSDAATLESEIDALRDRLADLDRLGVRRRRELTPLNALRRVELAKLAPSERRAAWWFEAMSGDEVDELVASLGEGDASRAPSYEISGEIERSRLPSLDALASVAIARASVGASLHEETMWLTSASLPGLEEARRLLQEPIAEDEG